MSGVNIEIERKYIIVKPCEDVLRSQRDFTESEIVQIYLPAVARQTRRVRRRAYGDRVDYIETRKIRIDKMSVTEIERDITEEEFIELSKMAAEGTHPVRKRRYTFTHGARTLELDFYPEWEHTCIMETELPDRETVVELPEFIKVVREVTGIKEYSNAAMSHAFPTEDKI